MNCAIYFLIKFDKRVFCFQPSNIDEGLVWSEPFQQWHCWHKYFNVITEAIDLLIESLDLIDKVQQEKRNIIFVLLL